MSSLISSSDFYFLSLAPHLSVMNVSLLMLLLAWLNYMPKFFLFLLEFLEFALLSNWSTWTQLLLFSSMLSFIVGALGGLSQYRVKRLLAYSSISHVGFLILALAVNSVSSVNSLLFYLVQYSLTNVLIFFVLIGFGTVLVNTVDRYSPVQFISQLKGQFHVNPLLISFFMLNPILLLLHSLHLLATLLFTQ